MSKLLNKSAILVIRCYQKFISPYKGFSCAHASLYHDASCSQAVIEILQSNELITSFRKIKTRFKACKQAYLTLQKNKNRKRKRRDKKTSWYDGCDPCISCDICNCGKSINTCDLIDLPCDCSIF